MYGEGMGVSVAWGRGQPDTALEDGWGWFLNPAFAFPAH